MTSSITRSFRQAIQFFLVTSLLLVGVHLTQAQIKKSSDGVTSKGIEPGAPAGSYPITEWENINLFNGQVTFSLPIVQKGRGSSGISLPIRISRHPWTVKHQRQELSGSLLDTFNAESAWWNPLNTRPILPGGSMVGRYVGDDAQDCMGSYFYMRTNTRLTFTAPDGTEYTLIDRERGGNPRIDTCSFNENTYRGNVFITSDGTSATFYSQYQGSPYNYADAIGLSDPYWTYAQQEFYPSGYLMLKDGTRYDISAGKVTRMRDRNGNETTYQETISYVNGNPYVSGYVITDSLKRQIVIAYDVNEGYPYGTCDRITLKGFGGADRIIRLSYTFYNGYLRTTQTTDPTSAWTWQQMFPQLDNYGGSSGPPQLSAIWLPDGNRSYQFKYNVYQELARVELPTGGAIEYDYEGGEPNGTASGVIGEYTLTRYPANPYYVPKIGIYRRLIERRVYKTLDISSLEGKTTYSKPTLIYNGGDHTSEMLVEQWNPSGTTCLGRSKHYFTGSGYQSQRNSLYDSVGSPWLLEGREYRTDVLLTTSTTTALRRVEHTWSNGSFIPNNNYGYPVGINPRIVETKTTLVDANLVAKQRDRVKSCGNNFSLLVYP